MASVAANFTDPAVGNLVTITNREGNEGDHTATVSNVSVSTAYEGTEGGTVTLTGITDEGMPPAEVQSYVISGFPTGATFSEGALSGDQWTISDPAQIAALATTPLTMTLAGGLHRDLRAGGRGCRRRQYDGHAGLRR